MKSVCKYCAQKEVGCCEECADRRAEIAERKQRRKTLKAALFGMPRETDELLAFNAERIEKEQLQASANMNGIIFIPIRR